MWYTIVTVLHVIVCFFLATVVLLQQGKGSDVSAVFGGSSQTLFGSSGAGNLLTKLTSASAILFMITSLVLTYGAARQSTQSLFDNTSVSTPTPSPTQETTADPQLETTTDPAKSQTATTPPETATPQIDVTTTEQLTATPPNTPTAPASPTPTLSDQQASPTTPPPPAEK